MNISSKTLANLKESYKSEERLLPDIKRHILRKIEVEESTRRTDVLHPSAMSDKDWCPRHDYYGIIGAAKSPDTSSPSFAMEMIYDYGNRIHTKYQTWWAEMEALWGKWQCLTCDGFWYGEAPQPSCKYCGSTSVAYAEVPLSSESLGIEGHADGVVWDGPNGWVLVEIKSIGLGSLRFEAPQLNVLYSSGELTLEQVWRNINKPFGKHLRQGQIYLYLMRETFPLLDITEMVFVYEWKPNQAVKTFTVTYSPEIVDKLLTQAQEVQNALVTQVIPRRPEWAEESGKVCESCDYRGVCYGRVEPSQPEASVKTKVKRADSKKRRRILGT